MTQPATHDRAPAARLRLTDSMIDTLPPVTAGRQAYRDAKTPQLLLRVGPKIKAWYVHATVHSKTQRVRLGPWPIVSADEARDRCLETLRKLYRGESVMRERPKPVVTASTVGEVLAAYLGSRKLSRQASADFRSIIGKHAADWSDKPIDSLTAPLVAARYRTIAADKPAQANRLLGSLGALDRYAHAADGSTDGALAVRVRSLLGSVEQVEARHVVIPDEGLAVWHRAAVAEGGAVSRYLRALMLTGCRANELRKLPRTGWDAAGGVVSITTTKNGKPHALPAGPHLRKLLAEEVAAVPAGGALFDVPVKVYRAAVERIGQAVGVDWHLHDLRRTFATVATRAGVDEGVLKALMNHSTAGNVTARHYVQRDLSDLQAPMHAVEARLVALWEVAA